MLEASGKSVTAKWGSLSRLLMLSGVFPNLQVWFVVVRDLFVHSSRTYLIFTKLLGHTCIGRQSVTKELR